MLETADIIRAVQANAKQHDAAVVAALQPLAPASKRLSMSFPIGAAVLDLVTGQKGVVVDGNRENVIVSPAPNSGG
jgi:hypothetical protein